MPPIRLRRMRSTTSKTLASNVDRVACIVRLIVCKIYATHLWVVVGNVSCVTTMEAGDAADAKRAASVPEREHGAAGDDIGVPDPREPLVAAQDTLEAGRDAAAHSEAPISAAEKEPGAAAPLDSWTLAAMQSAAEAQAPPEDDGMKRAAAERAAALEALEVAKQGYLDEDMDDDDDAESVASVDTIERYEREQDRMALQEWEEGVQQLRMAFQLVIIPFLGKWFGRQWSYWLFARWMR